jgi:hypothetical protein
VAVGAAVGIMAAVDGWAAADLVKRRGSGIGRGCSGKSVMSVFGAHRQCDNEHHSQ